jgi:hypothetical protein
LEFVRITSGLIRLGVLQGDVVMIDRLGNEPTISFRTPSGQVLLAAVDGDLVVCLGGLVRFGCATVKADLFGPNAVTMR